MNVQELIDELQMLPDKTLLVCITDTDDHHHTPFAVDGFSVETGAEYHSNDFTGKKTANIICF